MNRLSSAAECNCKFHSLCDTYQKSNSENKNSENSIENPSLCELENVHKVYNEIANHFSETRHSPWPQVTQFIQEFDEGSVLVDIGCGNGKYLQSNRSIFEVVSLNYRRKNVNQIFFYFISIFRLVAIEAKAY